LKDDAGLVHAYREGDDSAFEELVRRHQPRLRRQCARIVGIDDAEDAVQQALLSASRSLRAGDDDVDVGRWLHRVAHNASIDALRRRPAATVELDETIDGVPQPPDVALGRANLKATVAAIQELPDAQRRALLLSVFEDRSWEEIAEELGTGEGAVRGLLHRARRGMRTAVALCVFPFFLLGRTARAAMHGGGGTGASAGAGAGGIGTAGKIVAVLAVGGAAAGGATIGVKDSLRNARGTGSSFVASREVPGTKPHVAGGGKHGGRKTRHPRDKHPAHRGRGRRVAGGGGGSGSGAGGATTSGGSAGGGATTGGGSTSVSGGGQHTPDGTGGGAKLPGTGGDTGGGTETTPTITPTDTTPTDTTPTDTTPTDTTPTDTTPTDTTPEQPPAPATVARVDGFTPRGNGGLLHVIFDSGDDVRAFVGEYTVVTCDTVSNGKLVSQAACSPSNLATNERVVRATHAVNSGGSDVWNEVEVVLPS
jgi:RNA polymerase sigma-70 factor (ECF subfamily)